MERNETNLKLFYGALLAFFSLLFMGVSSNWNLSGFEWSATDMAVFFERFKDRQFLQGDFTTESMWAWNPRYLYGYFVLGLGAIFEIDWPEVFLVLKLLTALLIPPILAACFFEMLKELTPAKRFSTQAMAFATFLYVLLFFIFGRHLQRELMIGNYFQLDLSANPQAVAMLFAFFGFYFGLRKRTYFEYPLYWAAIALHPLMGLFAFMLFFTVSFSRMPLSRWFAKFFLQVAIPLLIVRFVFRQDFILDAQSFIDIYVKFRLPHHYHVGSWDKNFFVRFGILLALLAGLAFYFRKIKSLELYRYYLRASVLLLSCYWAQYLFIDIFPVKLIALLGLSRIAIFHFFLLSPGLIFLIARALEERVPAQFLSWVDRKRGEALILAALSLVLFGILFFNGDRNPRERLFKSYGGLSTWIESETNSSQVFLVPVNEMAEHFPYVFKRPVLISYVFPFVESYYQEYIDRFTKFFGPKLVNDDLKFYYGASLDQLEKAHAAYHFDFVIFEEKYFENKDWTIEPVFKDERFRVYSAQSLFEKL